MLDGKQLLDPRIPAYPPQAFMVYSSKIEESPSETDIPSMEIRPVAVATFARFYEAPGPQQMRKVKEARQLQSSGYMGRDYYGAFRNTLAETHWGSDDIETFEYALDGLVVAQKSPQKQENYRKLGDIYIKFWKKRESAHVFTVPTIARNFAGLDIRVVTEIGMRHHGDELALKLYLRAPQRPTRGFRQAVQHITARARERIWPDTWQAAILDLHREEILQPLVVPPDFDGIIEGQAILFKHHWKWLDEQAAAQGNGGHE